MQFLLQKSGVWISMLQGYSPPQVHGKEYGIDQIHKKIPICPISLLLGGDSTSSHAYRFDTLTVMPPCCSMVVGFWSMHGACKFSIEFRQFAAGLSKRRSLKLESLHPFTLNHKPWPLASLNPKPQILNPEP